MSQQWLDYPMLIRHIPLCFEGIAALSVGINVTHVARAEFFFSFLSGAAGFSHSVASVASSPPPARARQRALEYNKHRSNGTGLRFDLTLGRGWVSETTRSLSLSLWNTITITYDTHSRIIYTFVFNYRVIND